LILKHPKSDIKVHQEHIEIEVEGLHYVLGYTQIAEVYLNKNIAISLPDLMRLANKKPLSIINHYGYVVAEIRIPHAK